MKRCQYCIFFSFSFKSSCRINKQITVSQRIASIMDAYALSEEKSQLLPSLYVFFLDTEHMSYCRCSFFSLNPYKKNRHVSMALYPPPLFICMPSYSLCNYVDWLHTHTSHQTLCNHPKNISFVNTHSETAKTIPKQTPVSPYTKTDHTHGFLYCYTQ